MAIIVLLLRKATGMEKAYGKLLGVKKWDNHVPIKYRAIAFLYGCSTFYYAEISYPNDWTDRIITILPADSRRKSWRSYFLTKGSYNVMRRSKLEQVARYAFPLPF